VVGKAATSLRPSIAKGGIATDFAPERDLTLSSLDLPRDHRKAYVAAPPAMSTAPQEAAGPAPAPVPIRAWPWRQVVMTSGGFTDLVRARTTGHVSAAVALSPLVTRLERIEADLPMNTSFFAQHNFSAPARNVDELRAGLTRALRQGLYCP